MAGCVFDSPVVADPRGGGGWIFPGHVGSNSVKAYNCFVLPNYNASAGSGSLFGTYNGPPACTAEHCLAFANDANGSIFQLGMHGTLAGSAAGVVASCRSNILFWPASNANSYLIRDEDTPFLDAVTLSDYNAVHNPATSTITAAGSSAAAVGYRAIKVTAAGAGGVGGSNTQVGPHDFAGDPELVDTFVGRNMIKYVNVVHGQAATFAAAMAYLQANPSLIPSMIRWVRAGYAPTNAAYQAASYPGDPSTADANGYSWPGGAPGIGPMAYYSSSPTPTPTSGAALLMGM